MTDPITGETLNEDINSFIVSGAPQGAASASPGKEIQLANPPSLAIAMSGAVYSDGATVVATQVRLSNLATQPANAELKLWLGIPGVSPIGVLNFGSDNSFVIPAGSNQNFGPLNLFPVTESLPRGNYEFSSRMIDPVTGKVLSEDLNPFVIQ